MTQWAMLLLCAYIALGATSRLTRRQAGRAAVALTAIVIAVAMVKYSSTTPTDKYVPSVDSSEYATGPSPLPDPGTAATRLDTTGMKPATWLSTDHRPLVNDGGSSGGGG